MRRAGYLFLGLGISLLGVTKTVSGDEPPPVSQSAPSLHEPSGLNPYFYRENLIIDGPSVYWLVPASPAQRASALWCNTADAWDEILRVDGLYLPYLTRKDIKAYFSGAHGWPIHLLVRPKSGGTREVECFDHP